MPRGTGTYGSDVGRPSKKKKKKYQDGGVVDEIEISDASERVDIYQWGGIVDEKIRRRGGGL